MVQRIETTTGSGVPDLCILWKGRTIWVELKWKVRKLRPAQIAWHTLAAQQGIEVLTIVGKEKLVELYKTPAYTKTPINIFEQPPSIIHKNPLFPNWFLGYIEHHFIKDSHNRLNNF